MKFDFYDSPSDSSPILNGQPISHEDEFDEVTIEEMEEEHARMSRQREDLLAAGRVKETQDIETPFAGVRRPDERLLLTFISARIRAL